MPETPVTEFGARLKQARLARGISLAQIASVTKISVRLLEAVERNDFSRLPGGIFTRAFVRAYACEVGLDPEAALRQFLAQCPLDVAAVPTSAPESIDGPMRGPEWQEKLTWRHAAVVLGLAAAVAAAWWIWWRQPQPATSTTIASPPAAAAPVEAPPPVPPVVASRPAAAPVSSADAAVGAPVASGPAAVTATPTPAAPAPLTIEVVASAECWLFVSADGTPSPSRVYARGERFTVIARREVVLKAGDASALALTINGRAAAPLGPAGKVVTVRLTPETWTSFLARR